MQVRIGFFGSLRRELQNNDALQDVQLKIKPGTTLEELLASFHIPKDMAQLVVVNGKKASYNQKLNNHDRVSVFPYRLRDNM